MSSRLAMALAYDRAERPGAAASRSEDAFSTPHPHKFLTVSTLTALIVVCVAAAAAWEMGYERGHALAISQTYIASDADRAAAQTGRILDQLAALGFAFVARYDAAAVQDLVETTGAGQVLNIAVADSDGVIRSSLAGDPAGANVVAPKLLRQADYGRAVVPFSDPVIGSSPMTIILKTDEVPYRYIVIPLDPKTIVPMRALGATALVAPDGRTLAHSDGAGLMPAFVPYPSRGTPIAQTVASFGEELLVAATPVPGWPLAAAASSRQSDVLADWKASLPFYIFLIFGTVFAGAAIAIYLARHSADAEYWAQHSAGAPPAPHREKSLPGEKSLDEKYWDTAPHTPQRTLGETLREMPPRTRTAEIIPLRAAE